MSYIRARKRRRLWSLLTWNPQVFRTSGWWMLQVLVIPNDASPRTRCTPSRELTYPTDGKRKIIFQTFRTFYGASCSFPGGSTNPPKNQSKNDDICLTKLSKPCKESMGSSWTLGLQAPAAPAPLLAAEAMRRGSPAWHPAMRERGTPLRGAGHKDVLLWPTIQIEVYCGLCLWIWVLFWKFLIFSRMISLMLE